MSSTVFYDNAAEFATLTAVFQNASGQNTDPSTITCVVTDPSGTQVTHSYGGAAPADITRTGAGTYQLLVSCAPVVAGADGLWGYVFIGTGAVSDVQPGTWRVLPLAISSQWYVGLEEMKDRLGITDTADDSSMQFAIAATAGWINDYCGRHFGPITETRTYVPYNIYELRVDDIVPGASIAVNVDYNGDGIYEQNWVQNTDYQLYLGADTFNLNSLGIARPWEKIRVINSGKTFPFIYPMSPLNRVQVITTWGWPAVPWPVSEANRLLAADLFKSKDAPFGVAGETDLGVARIQSNPWLRGLLRAYVRPRRKVGV